MSSTKIKRIRLKSGKYAFVDEKDYSIVCGFKWRELIDVSRRYVITSRNKKTIYMHRLIMNAKKRQIIDHIDGNQVNNTRSNLRFCNNKQNQMNAKKQNRKTTSRFKGVYYHKGRNKWLAQIQKNGKWYYCGIYLSEKEAAIAYNKQAIKKFGEFSRLNKV